MFLQKRTCNCLRHTKTNLYEPDGKDKFKNSLSIYIKIYAVLLSWMDEICNICSRGRYFSPFLPDVFRNERYLKPASQKRSAGRNLGGHPRTVQFFAIVILVFVSSCLADLATGRERQNVRWRRDSARNSLDTVLI